MSANVLEIRGLSVDYQSNTGEVHAVDDVSLDLRRGEILGLAGESGSGKTTLANAVARLLRPPAAITAGSVLYHRKGGDPVDVLELGKKDLRAFRWRELAVVFQSAMNSLNPVATVGAQIDDVLRIHAPKMSAKERTERAVDLLGRVGISADRRRSYPHELSGGMRQRSAIAIALALNPEIIIMDEPTTALDVVVQRDILHEIRALREEYGFAVVFITHDLSLLMEISDRIAIMYGGRLVETGTATSLHRAPRHPYTRGLLRSFPRLRGPREELLGIPGTPPDLRSLPPGCAFHPRCPLVMPECSERQPLLLPGPEGEVACLLNDGAGAVQENDETDAARRNDGPDAVRHRDAALGGREDGEVDAVRRRDEASGGRDDGGADAVRHRDAALGGRDGGESGGGVVRDEEGA